MFPLPWNKAYRRKNGSLTTIDEAIAEGGSYTLPTASSNTKGGVKIGSGLAMEGEVLNNSNPTPYSLPTASSETLGGIKVGSGLTITDGVLSADAQLPASTSAEADKVLTVGSDGTPEWATPSSGSSNHIHNILLKTSATNGFTCQCIVVNESATPFTVATLNAWLNDNGYPDTAYEKPYPAFGTISTTEWLIGICCGNTGYTDTMIKVVLGTSSGISSTAKTIVLEDIVV